MAVTPTSQVCARAIQAYRICGFQSAERYSSSQQVGTNPLNTSDTVQISQEALDYLELTRQEQTQDVSKKTQTISEKDSELEESLKVLTTGKDASLEEIRKAYRQAIRNYHPDKHAYLPPEFRQLAEAKSKQINEMYSSLLRLKLRKSSL